MSFSNSVKCVVDEKPSKPTLTQLVATDLLDEDVIICEEYIYVLFKWFASYWLHNAQRKLYH